MNENYMPMQDGESAGGRQAVLVRADPEELLVRLGMLKAQNDRLKQMLYRSIYQRDLGELNAAYPEVGLRDLRELGREYARLRAAGISNAAAYNAISRRDALPQLGSVEQAGGQRDFVTPEEADRFTREQLDDPRIFALVRESMTRWK